MKKFIVTISLTLTYRRIYFNIEWLIIYIFFYNIKLVFSFIINEIFEIKNVFNKNMII